MRTRAARPGLWCHVEAVLGDGELVSVGGGVRDDSRPGALDSQLVRLIRLRDGRLAEMWTYRRSTP